MSADLTIFRGQLPPPLVLEPTREAVEARDEALAIARLTPPVKDAQTRQAAVDALALINRLLLAAEKARKALKAPYLEAGKVIDAEARNFVSQLQRAFEPLDESIKAWEFRQREIAQGLVLAKQAELDAYKAELGKVELSETARKSLIGQRSEELGLSIAPAVPDAARGQSVREAWDYEILDLAKVWDLYGSRLVELTEKRSAILDLINSPECPTELVKGRPTPRIAGLRIRRVLKQRIRPAQDEAAIDIGGIASNGMENTGREWTGAERKGEVN